MRKRIDIRCDMSSLAERISNMPSRKGPEHAAAVEQMTQLRVELLRARGVAERDISEDGHNISAQTYELSRASWLREIRDDGPSDWLVDGARTAHARWVERRPDLAAGDDWLAGVVKPENDDPEGA